MKESCLLPSRSAPVLLVRARCALWKVGDLLGEGLPAWGHFLCDVVLCGAKRGGTGCLAAGFQVSTSHRSCGSPCCSHPHPSQPVPLFLASNEAINELYRSPKLSLELDG